MNLKQLIETLEKGQQFCNASFTLEELLSCLKNAIDGDDPDFLFIPNVQIDRGLERGYDDGDMWPEESLDKDTVIAINGSRIVDPDIMIKAILANIDDIDNPEGIRELSEAIIDIKTALKGEKK
ncbi:MAG: hypothetical protein GY853_14495 [PVC group bacterium]|nr:hypothetical protein [PVC group bacterium]